MQEQAQVKTPKRICVVVRARVVRQRDRERERERAEDMMCMGPRNKDQLESPSLGIQMQSSLRLTAMLFTCCTLRGGVGAWSSTGVIILTVSGGYHSEKMWLFPINPSLRG